MSSSGWKNKVSRRQKKTAPKETWLTYENNYSWTDKQQNPDAERNTSDSNWLLPSENRTRRKHYSTHAALLFPALFASFHKKTWFSSSKFLHISQNILPVKKLKSMQRCVFVKCTHCSSSHLFSRFTSKRCTCNSQQKKTFYYHVFFQDFASVVAFVGWCMSPAWTYRDTDTARLCFSLAWLCDSLSDHCIRFSGNLRDSPHAPWTWVDEKHEWQDSWLSEQLMKMVRREEDFFFFKWSLVFFFFFSKGRQKMRNTDMSGDRERENKK